MDELTNRQQEILDSIKNYINEDGIPPTIKDIADKYGMTAPGMLDHWKALRCKGYLKWKDGKNRTVKVVKG